MKEESSMKKCPSGAGTRKQPKRKRKILGKKNGKRGQRRKRHAQVLVPSQKKNGPLEATKGEDRGSPGVATGTKGKMSRKPREGKMSTQ